MTKSDEQINEWKMSLEVEPPREASLIRRLKKIEENKIGQHQKEEI